VNTVAKVLLVKRLGANWDGFPSRQAVQEGVYTTQLRRAKCCRIATSGQTGKARRNRPIVSGPSGCSTIRLLECREPACGKEKGTRVRLVARLPSPFSSFRGCLENARSKSGFRIRVVWNRSTRGKVRSEGFRDKLQRYHGVTATGEGSKTQCRGCPRILHSRQFFFAGSAVEKRGGFAPQSRRQEPGKLNSTSQGVSGTNKRRCVLPRP